MSVTKLLIANRGEIAIRIARAAADLGVPTVAVHSEDDARSLHLRVADAFRGLPGRGAAAYLNADAIIAAANATACDAIHPGYGFLAERGDFARLCAGAGLTFVGPDVEHLELFGDKARARAAAVEAGVPVLRGLDQAVTLDEARAFFDSLAAGGAMIVKAVAGGGGRGTRAVLIAAELDAAFARCGGRGTRAVLIAAELDAAFARCQSEAGAAFGRAEVYVEEFIPRARHVEVQILGDRAGGIAHLGERECSIQRRFQKVLEIAPAPALDDDLRRQIIAAAVRFANSVGYTNLGTFEFLVDTSGRAGAQPFVFIEVNPRLQVEHTVTEAVTGVDLVQAQIRLAQGATLIDLGLDAPGIAVPRGYAIQTRVNMETLEADGSVRPTG
ncbi:MAG: carbamoyl-phosphate synthase large subunit, partial [Betaproteobacteria bacterium]|nr:carbamoyl-phosphate synthase large subunit [Betaproteobacteria bacterium]